MPLDYPRQIAPFVNEVDHHDSSLFLPEQNEVSAFPSIEEVCGLGVPLEQQVAWPAMGRSSIGQSLAALDKGVPIVGGLLLTETLNRPTEDRGK